ncbi:hypothetical protein KM043_005137 [Ampulex compressa]|nr:hypothetical protein KM043_005137 [Ampulex compressa]
MNVLVSATSLFLFFIALINFISANENEEYLRFPPNFLLGAASSAYQVEGAWNVSDKGESVWDYVCHSGKGYIHNNDTGDVSSDAYHKYKEDVAILKDIGFNSYRFSVSWPRVLPSGFTNKISADGIAYYKSLVSELVAKNIEPILTIYHWDHPQALEEAGGWLNPKMVDWFGEYARVIFRELGPQVKFFITINEPIILCTNAYAAEVMAPMKYRLRGISEYTCIEHMLKAHARAYRIYQEEFKAAQGGLVGANIQVMNSFPKDPKDTEIVDQSFHFNAGLFLDPVYRGDYSEHVKTTVARKSREQGYEWSRLAELGAEWKEYIKGTSDFLTLNHYTSRMIERGDWGPVPSHINDQGLKETIDLFWPTSNSPWLRDVPQGFGNVLRKLSNTYGNPTIYVAENGVSDASLFDDVNRIRYFQGYVREMLLAIHRDGVNVKGYMIWSFLDSFEWRPAYSQRFGIVHVDFSSPHRNRTLKRSAHWWKHVIKRGSLDLTVVRRLPSNSNHACYSFESGACA